ncbi:MAG: 2-C-methyl-D-erythritol 4-phosphate cytidylyltransferase [Planctomycetota bacterium]|nr:2-C-methyl-D-erythritol 4-phosphate cytidylyltransferase [Planctomycetota bacterium]
MKIAVILPAAGMGKRFGQASGAASAADLLGAGAGVSKIELDLAGKPVFVRSIELFAGLAVVGQILLAVNPDAIDDFRFRWGDKAGFHGVTLVAGGRAERWETVLKALAAVDRSCTHVAVHDAARPLASSRLIDRVFDAAERYPAVIPGMPVNATLKKVVDAEAGNDPLDAIFGEAGKANAKVRRVVATVDRSDLVEVQTPQVFEIGLLRRAYAQITEGKVTGKGITDDAGLVEALGEPIHVVEGEATNFKITRPDDLKLADAWVRATEQKTRAEIGRKRLFKDDDE